jgi:hypothetical protein
MWIAALVNFMYACFQIFFLLDAFSTKAIIIIVEACETQAGGRFTCSVWCLSVSDFEIFKVLLHSKLFSWYATDCSKRAFICINIAH